MGLKRILFTKEAAKPGLMFHSQRDSRIFLVIGGSTRRTIVAASCLNSLVGGGLVGNDFMDSDLRES